MPLARRKNDASRIDQRVYLRGVSWAAYESLLEMRGESSRPRISYLEGLVELMSPSDEHEDDKKRLARIVEAWSDEASIDLDGIGSWTIKKELVKRGAEPDECYVVLSRHPKGTRPSVPDFAIEVVRTSGGISKLEIYRLLGVPEVWLWEKRALSFHVLRGADYVPATRSTLLPTLDPKLIARVMTSATTQPEAVRALRRAMRKKPR